ncbi:MAG: DEAD/DEAH box helicase [Methanoculleus sp.]|uniref:DEAD/DEAH box helicase n=1 Tax=unclassified Methanoculleus TaxID=2619537 RepID=UPI0025DC80F8|nr:MULTISPECIES: DEAD/DEAH box helicase [unclassified Methanoculleus]MCK9318617.1 DEAD/DEAH box helicase [Methanoculleus sp.]MDD2254008.1 DEAD/DEAH box helicase [Methanoculleus sp.]MDD3216874.1 DEAD/DEAH box helicase [Methanoculleus sp.]MDD4314992.1 DEAD/DEAH box helicase [Methanoculleus sp.]MDD4471269.1 DEAD/DEAH box helicase [Methanoculleus sp.]
MTYISHPLIRPESIEERRYQLSIALRALDANTMVVLPTGLGKTAVALIVAASRLYSHPGRVLMLAPTKPLVEQHLRFFKQFLLSGDGSEPQESDLVMFTGETSPEERARAWEACRVCFATPQVIKNDCLAGRYSLADVVLLVVDECHRAVGNYAYVFLAGHYCATASKPLLLAMTASPGGDQMKVQEVCTNLQIKTVETRVETDEDVLPYIHERNIQYVDVYLPEELQAALVLLRGLVESRLTRLASLNFRVPKPDKLSIKALNALNAQIQQRIRNRDPAAFTAASLHAECMKLRHAISLAETQGSEALKLYLTRLGAEGASSAGSKASKRLVGDPAYQHLVEISGGWKEELHPKVSIVRELVRAQLAAHPDSRIIVFATYRDTVQTLVDTLTAAGIACERFVGQASRDAERGLSQKEQIASLARFREGEFKCLVATSVGEEGLDVPSTDMVIFYEAVPSEIRSIQRKGRTGRSGSGTIVVLVTKGTSDETFRYVSQTRERAMVTGIRSMSSAPAPSPAPAPESVSAPPLPSIPAATRQVEILAFAPAGPAITVDDRETSSRVAGRLHELGASITLERLEFGDYAIGDRILVERKTVQDFMNTLIERDLFGQLRAMADAAARPILIIEGEDDLYAVRNIHPNAIRGTLAAITVDMGIALMRTRDADDTAEMLYVLAQREGGERGERKVHPKKSYRSIREEQEYALAAFPNIGLKSARLLLEHFGSLKAIIGANLEELASVHGIGEKTAHGIWDLARRPYR